MRATVHRLSLATLFAAAVPSVAAATETIDLGVIRDEDIKVVQKKLYATGGRTEFGVHAGWMPFDAYVTTPNVQGSFDLHLSDTLGFSVVGGAGYSFKTGTYKKLESPAYGVAPYAFRYLGGALAGVQWAPVYAKMSVGRRIYHYDIYLAARAGVTVETSLLPEGGTPIAPTLSPAIGSRLFLSRTWALRTELRDDMMIQARPLTESTAFKQNVNITVGLTLLPEAK